MTTFYFCKIFFCHKSLQIYLEFLLKIIKAQLQFQREREKKKKKETCSAEFNPRQAHNFLPAFLPPPSLLSSFSRLLSLFLLLLSPRFQSRPGSGLRGRPADLAGARSPGSRRSGEPGGLPFPFLSLSFSLPFPQLPAEPSRAPCPRGWLLAAAGACGRCGAASTEAGAEPAGRYGAAVGWEGGRCREPGAGGCPHKAGGGSRGLSRPQNVPPSLAWGAGWRGGLCAACALLSRREVPGGRDGELWVMEILGAAGIYLPGSSQGCRHHTQLLAEKRVATARVSTCV